MKKKVLDWLKRNKDDLLLAWGILATGLAVVFFTMCLVFMAISDDLVGRIEMEVTEKNELKVSNEYLKRNRDYYMYLVDDLQQTYEDVVPKQQYIDDIEYLESVIRELRGEE